MLTTLAMTGCRAPQRYPEIWGIYSLNSFREAVDAELGGHVASVLLDDLHRRLELLFADVPIRWVELEDGDVDTGHLYLFEDDSKKAVGYGWYGEGKAEVYYTGNLVRAIKAEGHDDARVYQRLVECLAATCAHEVGHALGVHHNEDSPIMSGIMDLRDGWAEEARFLPGEVEIMRTNVYGRRPTYPALAEEPIEGPGIHRADLRRLDLEREADER